jgi:hypothetical protein
MIAAAHRLGTRSLVDVIGFPTDDKHITRLLLAFDDLLALVGQRSEALAGLTPYGHVYESSDLCWRSPSPSLKNSLLAIVARDGSP